MQIVLVNMPAFNEEENITNVIESIPKTILGMEVFVQVVDDGSKDKTIEVSRKAGADIVIAHKYNKGVGGAFKTAVQNFLEHDYDFLVNIDADGQFDVNDIKKLLEPLVNHTADITIGSRFSGTKADGIPPIKNILNQVIAKTVGTLMGTKIDDLTCGFRAYNREALFRLNLIETFTYTQETIIDGLGKNLRFLWIPVNVEYFAHRKSRVVKTIFGYIFKSSKIIFRTVRDVRPLIFFGLPGLILLSFGFIFLLVFFFGYIFTHTTTPYMTWLLTGSVFFSVGLLLFIFASVADMIKSHRKISEEQLYLYKKELYKNKN